MHVGLPIGRAELLDVVGEVLVIVRLRLHHVVRWIAAATHLVIGIVLVLASEVLLRSKYIIIIIFIIIIIQLMIVEVVLIFVNVRTIFVLKLLLIHKHRVIFCFFLSLPHLLLFFSVQSIVIHQSSMTSATALATTTDNRGRNCCTHDILVVRKLWQVGIGVYYGRKGIRPRLKLQDGLVRIGGHLIPRQVLRRILCIQDYLLTAED